MTKMILTTIVALMTTVAFADNQHGTTPDAAAHTATDKMNMGATKATDAMNKGAAKADMAAAKTKKGMKDVKAAATDTAKKADEGAKKEPTHSH